MPQSRNDSITVINVIKSDGPASLPDIDDEGRRMPPRPVECTISRNSGVNIQNVASEDISYFEIYDEYGICLGAFGDAVSFTDFFFSCSGELEVRFHTSQHVFRGYTSL